MVYPGAIKPLREGGILKDSLSRLLPFAKMKMRVGEEHVFSLEYLG